MSARWLVPAFALLAACDQVVGIGEVREVEPGAIELSWQVLDPDDWAAAAIALGRGP